MKSGIIYRRNVILLLCVLCGWGVSVYAKSVGYLPRNETLTHASTADGYSRILDAKVCDVSASLNNKIVRCQRCMQIKQTCPDCCLNDALNAKRCTLSDDPVLYDCNVGGQSCATAAFDSTECPAVGNCPADLGTDCSSSAIPHCQEKGCISGKPKMDSGEVCNPDSVVAGTWLCSKEENAPVPEPGCVPVDSTCQDCAALDGTDSAVYTVMELDPCPDAAVSTGKCYSYAPTSLLSNCMAVCASYAASWETYIKNLYCCRKNVCCVALGCASDEVGYVAHCDDSACDERLNWPECHGADTSLCCDNLTSDDCNEWAQELTECASSGSGGACLSCYAEIDSSFHFDFVAKSNEKAAIIWQIDAEPSYTPAALPAPATYFFTMVKVFEEGQSAPVHQSIVNQYSFTAAFSIFSATVVEGGVLQPGKKYSIRLYYFLPSVSGYTMESIIQRMELIMLRVRE